MLRRQRRFVARDLGYACLIATLLADQASKILAADVLLGPGFPVPPVMRQIVHPLYLTNLAKSLPSAQSGGPTTVEGALEIGIIALALGGLSVVQQRRLAVGLGLFAGGAAGNFTDLLGLGGAIDILELVTTATPVTLAFNLADVGIAVGGLLVWLEVIRWLGRRRARRIGG